MADVVGVFEPVLYILSQDTHMSGGRKKVFQVRSDS